MVFALTACGGGGSGGEAGSEGLTSSGSSVKPEAKSVPNIAPVANAGSDQRVKELRGIVVLDGSGSIDSDGEVVIYSWKQTAGPDITLSNTSKVSQTFFAPFLVSRITTTYRFQLQVTDNQGATHSDTVDITVDPDPDLIVEPPPPQASAHPVADAGPDQSVDEVSRVRLDGSGSSHMDGSIVSYSWSQIAGPSVTLLISSFVSPNFFAPIVTSNTLLTFQLVVTDDSGVTNSDTVDIIVKALPNFEPVARAGPDRNVESQGDVSLHGHDSSDRDGHIVSFSWSQTAGPEVILSSVSAHSPTFEAPIVTKTTLLTFRLVVTDNEGATHSDTVNVTVGLVFNIDPVANAGPDQSVYELSKVTLNGSGSDDNDGSIGSYAWSQIAGPNVTLSSINAVGTTFETPLVTSRTLLRFYLVVTDNEGATDSDMVDIIVYPLPNIDPVANAGPDQRVDELSRVILNGSRSFDNDGSIESFAWSQMAGPKVTLLISSFESPDFLAPIISSVTILTFKLVVTDNEGATHSDTVDIVVNPLPNIDPVAHAGLDRRAVSGNTVRLHGHDSNDRDGRVVSFGWSQIAGPSVILSSGSAHSPTFEAPVVASSTLLTFRLVVTDNEGATDSDTVNVTVDPVPNIDPVANAGSDQSVGERSRVWLDGSVSADADGNIVSYVWSQTAGPNVTLSSINTVGTTFETPMVTSRTLLTFRLIVTDNEGATHSDKVNIIVGSLDHTTGPLAKGAVYIAEMYIADRPDSTMDMLFMGSIILSSVSFISGDVMSFEVSPDRRYVAYQVKLDEPGEVNLDWPVATPNELYVVKIDDLSRVKIPEMKPAGSYVTSFGWAPDSSRIAWKVSYKSVSHGHLVSELYTSTPDGVTNLKVSGTMVAGGGVTTYAWAPDSSRIAYRADQEEYTVDALYTSTPDGVTNVKVSRPTPSDGVNDGDVHNFIWAPDSSRIAYAASYGGVELYSGTPDGVTNVKVSGPMVLRGSVWSYAWAPDSSRIAYLANQDWYWNRELYTSRPDGADNTKVSGPITFGGGVKKLRWAPNSSYIAYLADQDSLRVNELYTSTPDGAVNTKVSRWMRFDSDVGYDFSWAPDSSRIAYSTDHVTYTVKELYTTTPDGISNLRVSGPLVPGGDVESFGWAPDSTRIAYLADQDTDTVEELYVTSADAVTSEKISGPMVSGGGVKSFTWAPDGSKVFYAANQNVETVIDLYTSSRGGVDSNDLKVSEAVSGPGIGIYSAVFVDESGVSDYIGRYSR